MYQSIRISNFERTKHFLACLFIYPSNHHDRQNYFLFCPVLALLLIITMVWLVLWSEFQIVISSDHQYPSEHHHQEKQNDQTVTHTAFISCTFLIINRSASFPLKNLNKWNKQSSPPAYQNEDRFFSSTHLVLLSHWHTWLTMWA